MCIQIILLIVSCDRREVKVDLYCKKCCEFLSAKLLFEQKYTELWEYNVPRAVALKPMIRVRVDGRGCLNN